MPMIDARAVWTGDTNECCRLYRQFIGVFNGNFVEIKFYYRWKRRSMATALRIGQQAHNRRMA